MGPECCDGSVDLREIRAFVAVVEESGLSAAARRLHVTQPSLSQTISGLERRLGVELLVRSSSGVRPTEAGTVLFGEVRPVLIRHEQAMAAFARHTAGSGSVLRLGVPLELPADLLSGPVAALAVAHPQTRLQVRHLSTAAQLAALTAGDLDVGLVRQHPAGDTLDAAPAVEEPLGVLLAADLAAELAGPDGVRLDALAGLDWVGFPRDGSPAWHDELTAILRSHGLDPGPPVPSGQELIAEVKLAAVGAGTSFALAPEHWSPPLPASVSWLPLAGRPLVRRTWVVWPAESRRRDLGQLVSALSRP